MSRPRVWRGRGGQLLASLYPLHAGRAMQGSAKGCEWAQVLAGSPRKEGRTEQYKETYTWSRTSPNPASSTVGSSLSLGYLQRGRLRYFRMVLTFSATECWEMTRN